MLVGPLLHGLAVGRALRGGTELILDIPGGRRIWVVRRLLDWADAHDGYAPRYADWQRPGLPDWEPETWPSAHGVTTIFRFWSVALAAAGLQSPP